MGVVHKLKQEVRDFIIQAKREQTRISVRELADLASRKFRIKISKSSISNILKDVSLSSPVGRPARQKKEKIFMIPDQAKERIRGEMKKIGLAPGDTAVPPGDAGQDETKALSPEGAADAAVREFPLEDRQEDGFGEEQALEPVSENPGPGTRATRAVSENPPETIPQPESLLENLPASVSAGESAPPDPEFHLYQEEPGLALAEDAEKKPDKGSDRHLKLRPDPMAGEPGGPVPEVPGFAQASEVREVCPGLIDPAGPAARAAESAEEKPAAGTLVLYAVAQALTGKAFFAELLAEDIARHDLPGFDQLCLAEIFYQWLGHFVSMAPEVVDQSALWPALGFSRALDRGLFQQRLEKIFPSETFKLKYALEREQLDIEVAGFRVVLKDEGTVFIDAFNKEAGLNPLVRVPFGRPLNLAVLDLSQQIISGLRPLVIHHLPESESALTVLRYLGQACAGHQGGPLIKRAALLNFQGEEIASFNVAAAARTFLIGAPLADPALGRFGEFLKKARESLAREVWAGSASGQYRVCPVERDVAAVSSGQNGYEGLKLVEVEAQGKTACFLTNGAKESVPELLERYAGRWGYRDCSEIEQSARSNGFTNSAGSLGENWKEMPDLFLDFGEYLAGKAVAWLFPPELSGEAKKAVLRALCLLPGKVIPREKTLIILLNIQKIEPDLRGKILIIITQFNKYDFYDAKGRKISIKAY